MIPLQHVNQPPNVMLGCTQVEISQVILGLVPVVIIISIVIGFITGHWFLIFPLLPILLLPLSYFSLQYLRLKKEDRPDGYFALKAHLIKVDFNIQKSALITRVGHWDIGQSIQRRLS